MSREEVLQKELFEDKESYNDEPLRMKTLTWVK